MFLEALVAFAFQQFGLAFPPSIEQLEVIYAVVTGRRSSDRIWQISLFTILFICVRDTCVPVLAPSLVISPLKALMEDQLQEIAKYGITRSCTRGLLRTS